MLRKPIIIEDSPGIESTIPTENYFFLLIMAIIECNLADPIINIWLLSRYIPFLNLSLSLIFYCTLNGIVIFYIYKTSKRVKNILVKLLKYYCKLRFVAILINHNLLLIEYVYSIFKVLRKEIFFYINNFYSSQINLDSIVIALLMLISFLNFSLIINKLTKKYLFRNKTASQRKIKHYEKRLYQLIILFLFIFSYYSFSFDLLRKIIISIGLYVFLTVILIKSLNKRLCISHFVYHFMRILNTTRLLYILLILNRFSYDYLLFYDYENDLLQESLK